MKELAYLLERSKRSLLDPPWPFSRCVKVYGPGEQVWDEVYFPRHKKKLLFTVPAGFVLVIPYGDSWFANEDDFSGERVSARSTLEERVGPLITVTLSYL